MESEKNLLLELVNLATEINKGLSHKIKGLQEEQDLQDTINNDILERLWTLEEAVFTEEDDCYDEMSLTWQSGWEEGYNDRVKEEKEKKAKKK